MSTKNMITDRNRDLKRTVIFTVTTIAFFVLLEIMKGVRNGNGFILFLDIMIIIAIISAILGLYYKSKSLAIVFITSLISIPLTLAGQFWIIFAIIDISLILAVYFGLRTLWSS